MNYLLDANTLIEAKNRYYHMKVCPGYWDWLLLKGGENQLGSIVPVLDELKNGKDELTQWADDNDSLFAVISDDDTQASYSEIAQHVAAQAPSMKPGALESFLGGADPWLIAKAHCTGATVVTHETMNPDARRRFLIPNVCEHFDVDWMNTFELLLELDAEFVLNGE